jgi:hypothetical protein
MPNPDWFAKTPKDAPRAPTRGEELWRVRLPDGHVHSCELRDHSRLGAAWELQILVDGELLFGRPCVYEHQARRVAEMAKGDSMRQGCIEA